MLLPELIDYVPQTFVVLKSFGVSNSVICSGWRSRVGVGVVGVFGVLGVVVTLEFFAVWMEGGVDTAKVRAATVDFGVGLDLTFDAFKSFVLEVFLELDVFLGVDDFFERDDFLDTSRFDI